MAEELISVIVPVYNAEKYLSVCLDSIVSQSYRNLEIIVINDGSTDFSFKIAEQYAEKDNRIKVYNYENEGQAEARNHALSVATGDFIIFVDADDIMLPDAIRILKEVIDSNNEVDIAEGKVIKGENFKAIKLKKKENYRIFNSSEAIENILYQRCMLPSPYGKIYRRSLFEGIVFTKGLIYEDLDIFYKIFGNANKVVYIDRPVYFYRINENSTINTWNSKRLDVLKVTAKMESYFSGNRPELLKAAKDRRLSANFNMFALCSIHGDKENASKCWDLIKQYRKTSLFNSNVRFKNKTGILLSYLGKNVFNLVAKWVYK